MDKAYRNTAVFMVLVILGVQWGFYRNYISQFPSFKDQLPIHHIHGMLMMAWLVLLVIQPLLIAYGKAHIHRSIGKVSYVLGPLIIISLFLIGKTGYMHGVSENYPLKVVNAVAVLDIRGFFSFPIFWSLAMINRKKSSSHMRYMIGTGILGIGPGVGRGLTSTFQYSLWDALMITDVLGLVIVGSLLGYDIYRKKNYRPYLVVFCVLAFGAFLWMNRDSGVWQSFSAWYANMFY